MAAARQRFFTSLPGDDFLPWEHALRKTLMKALGSNSGVLPLQEWIDRRIGGEIETRRDETGNLEIFQRGAAPPPNDNVDKEAIRKAFFETLSPDAFAPPEEALREAVFDFLATWRSPELANLQQMSNFPLVQQTRAAFLPKNVSLKAWIEHRIGGEIEFRKGARNQDEVILTETARLTVMKKFQMMSHGPPPMGPGMGYPPRGPMMGGFGGPPPPAPPMDAPGYEDAGKGNGKGQVDKQTFFNSLPADELLPLELALREALIKWVTNWPENRPATRAPGSPPRLSDSGMDQDIKRRKSDFLPPKVKLIEWIETRIGGEIELRQVGKDGQHEVFLRGAAPPQEKRTAAATQEEKEAFFAALPEDEFSAEEESLRAVFLDFLERWTGEGPPSIQDAASEEEFIKARRALLPKTCPVSLKEWIDKRIGGELETMTTQGGQWIFGIRGTLPEDAAAASTNLGSGGPQGKNNAGVKRRRV